MTRATRELTVLCIAMGGRPETIAGLAGVGDLMLTAFGEQSREDPARALSLSLSLSRETILSLSAMMIMMMMMCVLCFRRAGNRSCGLRLSRGETLEEILQTTTVEGVPTAAVAVEFAKRCNLDLPLFQMVHGILSGEIESRDALELLMKRPLGGEVNF